MGKRILRPKLDFSDFPHRFSQIRGPWNTKRKITEHHGDFYYGNKGSDVTMHHHLPPPPHSYHPDLINARDPYFGREGCDVTEYMRYVSGSNPPDQDYWHGVRATDISDHLRSAAPPAANPLGDIHWGRPKSYVTDPSVSPNLTPPARPMDGVGCKGAMDWPAKSREDQVPLGKSMSKFQSMVRAQERSQKARKPLPPPPCPLTPPEGKKVRYSPGQPVGKRTKQYVIPQLKIKIPPTDNVYWGRTKSYITDYAISPNLTPPGRPIDGEGARDAMTFVPITPKTEEKIPLGKSVRRIAEFARPNSTTMPLKLGSPSRPGRPQTSCAARIGTNFSVSSLNVINKW
jgi:hypothetical protein